MKALGKILLGTAIYGGLILGNFAIQKNAALRHARSLSRSKGIINLGSGCLRTGFSQAVCELPEIVYNVDQNSQGVPKCIILNLEDKLPFSDKQFDVAFSSHVLEHLKGWEQALDEWHRIADHVVLVLPNPLDISGYIHPDHKTHFSLADMEYIRQHWRNTHIYS